MMLSREVLLLCRAESAMLCQQATLFPQATLRPRAEHLPQVMCPEPVSQPYRYGQLLRRPRLLWCSCRKRLPQPLPGLRHSSYKHW